MFQGFPEIKEALMSNKMQAGFMVAPMAIALRAQGVPIKIVYLGHRYGSAVVVRNDGPVRTVADLRGRVVAIPSRFSDERLIIHRALRQNNIGERFEDDQTLIRVAARNGDNSSLQIGERFHRSVFAHHDRATVTVAEVNDFDRHALSTQGNGHRCDHERRLHLIRDQRFLDLGKSLKHPRDEQMP